MRLSTSDHDRAAAQLTYVYPVVSRRAGGVSVGINLNTNNACNWRCVYCQVPGLVQGRAPDIDVELLGRELDGFLQRLLEGDYMERNVPEGARRLNDIAFSGNGEPTSSPQFGAALARVAEVRERHGLAELKTVLITNGSLIHKPPVADAVARLSELAGEVWYKLDRATDAGQSAVNSVSSGTTRALANLRQSAQLCSTWIQSCVFARRGAPPSEDELDAYLACLGELVADRVPVRGVLLYGLARLSHQPEAPELSPLTLEALEALGARIRQTGLDCRVSL